MELYAIHPEHLAPYLEAISNATPEERSAAMDRYGEVDLPDIVSLNEADRSAAITISGVLTPNGPSPIARFFGFSGTAYNDIIAAAGQLKDNPAVDTVYLRMDTPGGLVAGMGSARKALDELAETKTVVAENHGLIASAGYYLATAASKIVALSPLAKTGSIGVIIAGLDMSKALEKAGVKKVRIVSKNAPNKQPDPSTDTGLAQLQKEVDASERVFLAAVAEGRSTTVEDIAKNYGQGGILIAQDPDPDQPDALSVGMIDEVSYTHAAPMTSEDDDQAAGPTTFRDFPIVDRPWDADAAIDRVRRFLGAEDAPNQRYRQAFFWYDAENSDNFGAYKLPFVDVVDGRLTAIWRGVSAANGAMAGARGQRVDIPEADRSRVQSHIDRYRDKWQKQKNNGGNAAAGGGSTASDTNPARDGGQREGATMDLNQLKAEHPAVYEQAVALGVTQERERVEAHITLGEASGDMDLAISCIAEGKEFTPAINAKYQAAGMKKAAQGARSDESEDDLDADAADDADENEQALAQATADVLGVDIDG